MKKVPGTLFAAGENENGAWHLFRCFIIRAMARRIALVEDDVLAVYERALADGKGDKVASEEFDDALERIGL